jgi:hypothetical protein
MLPRMIDIARGMLPGGDSGAYLIGREKTLSAIVLAAFGVSVPEFVELVGQATTDDEVASRLWPAAISSLEKLNDRLRRVTVANVPAEVLADFQRFYGTEHSPERLVFDILEADDARIFGERPSDSTRRTQTGEKNAEDC